MPSVGQNGTSVWLLLDAPCEDADVVSSGSIHALVLAQVIENPSYLDVAFFLVAGATVLLWGVWRVRHIDTAADRRRDWWPETPAESERHERLAGITLIVLGSLTFFSAVWHVIAKAS